MLRGGMGIGNGEEGGKIAYSEAETLFRKRAGFEKDKTDMSSCR